MRAIILFLMLLLAHGLLAQTPPELAWQGCYGGSGQEGSAVIDGTQDGGLIIASFTQSNNGQVTGYHGNTDIWVVKLDESGSIQWQRCLGGSGYDAPAGVHATSDGGYLAVGFTNSTDGDVSGNHGSSDAWVVKLTATGEIEWQRAYGGTGAENARASLIKPNGNLVIVGASSTANGDVTSNAGSADVWVLELDPAGNLVWQSSYGGPSEDTGWAMGLAEDGSILALGVVFANGGLVQGVHGANDIWVLRLTPQGDLLWRRCIGGTDYDWAFGATKAANGDWLIVGSTDSNDGDVAGYHGMSDAWIVRLDDDGELAWQRPLGGSGSESIGSVVELNDGSLLIPGGTNSSDGDVQGMPQSTDAWVLNLSGDGGTIHWQTLFGGSGNEGLYRMHRESVTGFTLSGSTASNDGDVFGNHGNTDAWLARITPLSGVGERGSEQLVSVYPNPAQDALWAHVPEGWDAALRYSLFDATGQLALMGQLPDVPVAAAIDLSRLSAGAYALVLQDRERLAFGKVTVAR